MLTASSVLDRPAGAGSRSGRGWRCSWSAGSSSSSATTSTRRSRPPSFATSSTSGRPALDPGQGHRARVTRPSPRRCSAIALSRAAAESTDPTPMPDSVVRPFVQPRGRRSPARRRSPRSSWSAACVARSTSRPPRATRRLFVVEQGGRIRIVRGGAIVAQPFLDISGRDQQRRRAGPAGPRLPSELRRRTAASIVNYTDPPRRHRTSSEFRVSANADVADAGSERDADLRATAVREPQRRRPRLRQRRPPLRRPSATAARAAIPLGNGQNLGTAARQDAAHRRGPRRAPSRFPADNPFVGTAGAVPRDLGLRPAQPVPLRLRPQHRRPLSSATSARAAWRRSTWASPRAAGARTTAGTCTEGTRCFISPRAGCNRAGITLPVAEYGHADGCSVTGGVVYRGCRLPGYAGTYFYGDYCTAFVRSFRLVNGQATDAARLDRAARARPRTARPRSAPTPTGEVYIVDQDGEIYKVVPAG